MVTRESGAEARVGVREGVLCQGCQPHGVEEPGAEERRPREKMNLIAEAADWKGDNDAARHMAHYLGNSGTDMDLPVDKMMSDVRLRRAHRGRHQGTPGGLARRCSRGVPAQWRTTRLDAGGDR